MNLIWFLKRNKHWLPILILAIGIASILIWELDSRRPAPIPVTAENSTSAEPYLTAKPSVPPGYETPAPLSERIAEYHMAVELNAEEMTLHGSQQLTWKNPGNKPVKELYFHLYANAFESRQTTFVRESGGKLRNDRMKEDGFGHIRVHGIKTVQGRDLTNRMTFVQPDDGNKEDRTLAKLVLPAPVNPGETITLLTRFSVKLPKAFARMGYVGDFVMAGQWFPKLAAYEKKGTRGRAQEGWNLHQYHGNSEFYSNFGIYNVKIRVPSNYTVAATGFPTRQPVIEGKTKLYQFYAEDVHDFAWAASPRFIYYEEPYSTPHIPGVKIKLYLDPAHEHLKNRYMSAAKRALTNFSEWYGPYPYSTLSIVVPPAGGGGTGGMEYPTLITAWDASATDPDLELERVVIHEIGHQYWYGMVASNEFEEAWLDEGLTSYSEDKVMSEEYGVSPNLPILATYITDPAPLKQYAWHYAGHRQYADNVYTRAKLVLTEIEKQIGENEMRRVLKTYFQRWKFRHPSTADFQRVLSEVTKKDWNEFFNQFVYGKEMVDYAVAGIRTRKIADREKTMYESNVVVQRNGGFTSPVLVRIRLADGTLLDKQWNGQDAMAQFRLIEEFPVEWAFIDPEHSLVLENKRINNFMKTNIDKKWSIRWNLGVTKLIETLLYWVAW